MEVGIRLLVDVDVPVLVVCGFGRGGVDAAEEGRVGQVQVGDFKVGFDGRLHLVLDGAGKKGFR